MPESPEELYDRAANALRMPALGTWDSFPFEGTFAVRPLQRPLPAEPPREGQGGRDCGACAAPDASYLWTNDRWRVRATEKPSGLRVVVFPTPRSHIAEPAEVLPPVPEGVWRDNIAIVSSALAHVE